MMKPAIVLSAHTMGLGVARALGMMGVPVVSVHYDERDMAHVSKYVCEAVPGPHPEHDEDQFVDLLVRCAERFGGGC
ncbi:MAG: hypothetical protein M5R40_21795 [Anaerolineae bacterium]|nr:hypothetical protein [Anaerolineae bacterium]